MAVASCPRQIRVLFQVQGRESIGQTAVAKLFVLLIRVQALEAAIRPDPREMIRVVRESIRQSFVVVLLQAIRRRILRMSGVQSIRILQGIEAVAGRRQRGAGPLQRFEL